MDSKVLQPAVSPPREEHHVSDLAKLDDHHQVPLPAPDREMPHGRPAGVGEALGPSPGGQSAYNMNSCPEPELNNSYWLG
jgi:hypothetical protein